jgi:urease accessory protein
MIALGTIAFGLLLSNPLPIILLPCLFISLAAGIFQGYASGESIISSDMTNLIMHLIGVTLTQTVIFLCVRQFAGSIGLNATKQVVSRKILVAGLVFCGIGMVFLGDLVV